MPTQRFGFSIVPYCVPRAGAFPATPLILRNITLPLVVAYAPNRACSLRFVLWSLHCGPSGARECLHPPSLVGAPDAIVLDLVAADDRHCHRTGSPRRCGR